MFALLILSHPQVVLAAPRAIEGVTIADLSQEDEDQDGILDHTIILCSFATEGDRIDVFDGARDMVASDDWQQAADFDNDAWVFDAGGRGRASLIIVFTTQGDQHIATLYDDRDGDGKVSYRLDGKLVIIQESPFWTARVVASGSWYNADGSLNRNLLIQADGPIGTNGLDTDYALDAQLHDGTVDLQSEARIGAGAAIQGYSLTQSFSPVRGGIPRTIIRANAPGYSPPEVRGFVFWPHLGPSPYSPSGAWEIVPALRMDWATARIDRYKGLNDIVQQVPPERGWRVYSQVPVSRGAINHLDFENPFAFYDLASDGDGWPELIVRHTYTPPGRVWYQLGEHYVRATDPRVTRRIVRYTWDQDNDRYWDYKLGLFGQSEVTTTVSFPDFDIISLPYDRLPWVLTNEPHWAGATFVQVEGQAEASPEGVYEWDEISWLTRQRIFGIGDRMDEGMNDIRTHFRGDYWVGAPQQARLYLSGVDRKLHLLGAEAGVWNIDGSRRIRYQDLDEDGYVDQWVMTAQFFEFGPEEPVMSLQMARGMLVYGGLGHVKLLRQQVAPSLLESLPPRDHAEWQALGAALERYRRDFGSLDLVDMLDQFGGPAMEITGAELEDFRLTADGFRFALHLRPGFVVAGEANEPALSNLPPGSYLVTYDGAFRAQPLTSPHIVLPAAEFFTDPAAPGQMSWATVKATLHNTGLRDVTGLPVRLYAALEGREPYLLGESRVSVPGAGTFKLSQSWAPMQPGRWTFWLEAGAGQASPSGAEIEDLPPLMVDVPRVGMPSMIGPWQTFDGVRLSWPVALQLASASLAALSVLLIVLRHAGSLGVEAVQRGQDPALDKRGPTGEE